MASNKAPMIGADLDGKVAFITGGGTGIGSAAARRLSDRGARVAIVGRRIEPLQDVAAETGALAIACDITDGSAVDAAVTQTVADLGGLDIVVNNAGTAGRGGIEAVDDDTWDQMVDINLKGPVRVARAAVPHLRAAGGGAVVNVASIGALFAAKQSVTYGTTKAALLGLTRSMAVDLGSDHIRVNTLCPGWVDTPMAAGAARLTSHTNNVDNDAARDLMVHRNPIQRLSDPDEIAACIEFLASSASSFITGAVLVADGGQSIVDLGTLSMFGL